MWWPPLLSRRDRSSSQFISSFEQFNLTLSAKRVRESEGEESRKSKAVGASRVYCCPAFVRKTIETSYETRFYQKVKKPRRSQIKKSLHDVCHDQSESNFSYLIKLLQKKKKIVCLVYG